MLLANMAKSPKITGLLTLKRDVPKPLSSSPIAIDQLLDCFVKGAGGSYNKNADYDYLSYLFADLAKHKEGRTHFLSPHKEDADIVPLTKLIVFTEHKSTIRRRGVANTIKNTAFETDAHARLISDDDKTGTGLLPYILLPLMGSEEYADDDTDGMLDETQLLQGAGSTGRYHWNTSGYFASAHNYERRAAEVTGREGLSYRPGAAYAEQRRRCARGMRSAGAGADA